MTVFKQIKKNKREVNTFDRKINKRIDLEKNMLQGAFAEISNIADMKSAISFNGVLDDAYQALKYVIEHEKINSNIMLPKNEKDTSYNKVVEMSKSIQIKFRTIVLQEKWWKKDIGSFIAFKKDSGKAVAILMFGTDKYKIFDPDSGVLESFKSDFMDLLEDRAIVLYRGFPNRIIKIWDILKFFILNVRKKDIFTLLFTGIITGLLSLISPIAMGEIFDYAIPKGDKSIVFQIFLLLLSVEVSKTFLSITSFVAVQRMELILDNCLEHAVWDRLLSLPTRFFGKFSSGEINSKVMGISKIRSIITGETLSSIIIGFFLLFNVGLMLYYNVVLTIFSIITILIFVSINFSIGYMIFNIEKKEINIRNKMIGFVYQLIRGITKIKVANAENRAFYKWTKLFTNLQKISFKADYIRNILTTFSSFVPIVSTAIIFLLVIKFTDNGLSVGHFIAFFTAFSTLQNGMINISSRLLLFADVLPIYEAAKPILEEEREININKPHIKDLKGNIKVSNLVFRYQANGPFVISNISFSIKSGEYVAFVGASGSGKSTLIRLLLGFEVAKKGEVSYDGNDISKIDVQDLRSQMGVVLQNGNLISGSIFRNIVGYNNSLTMEDAWESAEICGIAEDIEKMPMSMHTLINEGANNISGGQRQRIILARAISKKPKIILLDEATSALDNVSQEIISENLQSLNATRIVIAHRISTIVNCDRIYVLKKGKIVEIGKFQELMDKKGEFYMLAKRQITSI